MKSEWHIMIATTLSMLITFAAQCIFEEMRTNHSEVQQIKDLFHVYMLSKHCYLQDRLNCTMYDQLLIDDDHNDYEIYVLTIVLMLSLALLLCYGMNMFYFIHMLIGMVFVVWLLDRYCQNQNCWYQFDILSVYFIVWQFMYLMYKWELLELSWPLLILQQASYCISTSVTAFFFYDILFRDAPFQFFIGFLWLCSFYDTVACLHINGRFYNKLPRYQPETLVTGVCYSYDIEDNEEVDENSKEFLGLGDFIVYNLMILFIIHPIWSMTTKVFVAFGCIVFIQVGYYSLGLIGKMWHVHIVPGVPFPVITFSLYAIVVDFVMNYSTIDCSNV